MPGSTRKRERTCSTDASHDVSLVVTMEAILNSNFEELARRFPEFGMVWKRNSKLHTPEVRMALAKTLLQTHWRISLSHVPDHFLCPPIPNRYFYVRWMLDEVLPVTSSPTHFDVNRSCDPSLLPPEGALDIGTGAFCIYPLLMAANDSKVHPIFASDVDPSTLECAQQHVTLNNLQSRISLLLVPPSQQQENDASDDSMMDTGETHHVRRGPLLVSLEQIGSTCNHYRQLQFAMTNPPFYNVAEVPVSQTNMTQNEGHYPDGEIGFGMDMLVDGLSLYLSAHSTQPSSIALDPPVWTSTMCGKKSSWVVLRNTVTQLLGPGHVCASEFGPGSLTRWFLAWTFKSHPNVRSPLARHDAYGFEVPNATASEVVGRLREYCATFPWGALNCVEPASVLGGSFLISEAGPPALGPWKGDEGLPNDIQNHLSGLEHLRNLFLPREGHFCIEVSMENHQNGIQVNMVSYIHSENGRKTTDKIRGQLEGEIGRTNRRWRRKHKVAT